LANVAHSTLTAAHLHEPKGIAAAIAGQVYIADGAGSGTWTTVSGLSFTGQIADWLTPVAPTGWLECNGAAISTTTYQALYEAMSIRQTGDRTNGSPIVTGLSSTTNMRAGYYVFGTGIASGTTILTVDSSSQITLSANASSTSSDTIAVSPWLLNTGTISLPDATTVGRYRRSRTSSVQMGILQASQNLAHTHGGTTASDGIHSHVITISDPGHAHTGGFSATAAGAAGGANFTQTTLPNTGTSTTGITATSNSTGGHTHSFTTASDGGTETRPVSLVVMTCVKT